MWQKILCIGLLFPLCAHARVWLGEVTHVSDGDTLWIKPGPGVAPRKVRLLGLDAPELCQAGGMAARAALQALVAKQPVQVSVDFQDSYGRDLARLQVDGRDVGATLVGAGHAWSSRWRGSVGPYAVQEASAKAAGLGLFADPAAELPRDFRKRHGPCQTGR
ncbi:thermonuclease family protein [Rhodoferax sp.]|uniref:thermonuclease family protein n=1 Tax=Rhodoferax sp. TaxID=50421 RepID=UPI002609E271|nr:thermonuclease family protein [Rhodoferax sp.]MDD3936330.1 thermonuclease family protein [Rhodoferax sp.]